MSSRSRTVRMFAAVVALALAAAGCGDDDGSDEDAATRPTAVTERNGTVPEAVDTDATVAAMDSDLGEVLTSGGMTLYAFTPDESADGSACLGECAETWPPLLVDGEVTVGDGLDDGLFDTVERVDGDEQEGEQVTVDDRPLYFFTGDSSPGEMNGRGLEGLWYLVSPGGELIGMD